MIKPFHSKKELVSCLAHLEVALSNLQDEVTVLEHKNVVVEDCIAKALKTLDQAVQKLGRGDFETAVQLASVVYLRVNFGKQLMVAEILESEIGESDFLQLTELENESARQSSLSELFKNADAIIQDFIGHCKATKGAPIENKET